MKKYLVWAALVVLGGVAVSCQSAPAKKPAEHHENHEHHDGDKMHHDTPCRRS